jgi:hypothetical protein
LLVTLCVAGTADPIHQFEIHPIVKLGQVGGHEIAFANSPL